MSDNSCSVPACSRAAKSRGWCGTHYERWRITGSIELAPREQRTCSHDGCGIRHYSKGMCKPHYRQAYYATNGGRERATHADWRAGNREYDRARWAAWYAEHADELAVGKRARHAANPEAGRRRGRRWREANPGYSARWRRDNPERWALRNRENGRRRHRRDGRPVRYADILAEHGMHCHLCEQPIADLSDLHFDHVIPLARDGLHVPENIRPAHARCNLRKGTRLL